MHPNQQQQQMQMNLDMDKTTELICDSCEHTIFTQAFEMRKLSKLVSPTGEAAVIPVPIFVCSKCGERLNLEDIK